MTTEPKSERNKLLVMTIFEPKPVGEKGAIKYSCKVKAGDKEFILQTFAKRFGDYFKPGDTIDAEYSVTTRENPNDPEHPWIDRKVSQIYVDGKAVEGDKSRGGWRPAEDSPEKRASIEAQSAVQAIVQLRVADKLKDDSPVYITALNWCTGKLSAKPVIASEAKQSPSKGESPQPAKDALFPPRDGETVNPQGGQGASAKAGPVEEPAQDDEVSILAGQLKMKMGWKDPTTAMKYIEQQTGKTSGFTKDDLAKVRKVAKL